MTQFATTSDTIRVRLADCDRDLDAQRRILQEAAIDAALGDDSPVVEAAQDELTRLGQRRAVLVVALGAAEAQERDRADEAARRAVEGRRRALAQHLGACRAASADIAGDLASLAQHYGDAAAALERIAACVGDTRPYPDLHANTLRRLVTRELWRASAVPTIEGDRSPLVETPHGAGAAHTTPSLVDVVAALTRHWAAIHRAATGLVGRVNAAPTDDTGAGE